MNKVSQNLEAGKRPNWIKRIGLAGAGGVVLLLAGYFFCTSGFFIESQVLSRIGKQLNAKIKVESISVGLFSGASLSGLDVRTEDETLVKAQKAVMKYSLMDLLSGRIRVNEFSIEAPEVSVVVRSDNSSNLDPIVKALNQNKTEETTTSGPLDLLIKNVSLSNARFRFQKTSKRGLKQVTEADQVNIKIDQIGTGIAGNLSMQTRIKFEAGPASLAPTDAMAASIFSKLAFDLDANLMPKSLMGGAQLNVSEAIGNFKEAAKLEGILNAEISGQDIRGLSFDFKRDDVPLGDFGLTGTFDINNPGGKFLVSINNIGKSVLSMVGAPLGIGFGDSVINSRNEITIANAGQMVDARGELKIDRFAVSYDKYQTPANDLHFKYAGSFDEAKQEARLETFNLSGKDGAREFLTAALSRPLTYSLGTNTAEVATSASVALQLKDLDLARWSGVVGDYAKGGKVDADLSVTALGDGRQLNVEAREVLRDVSVVAGTNILTGLNTDSTVKLSLANLKDLKLEQLNMEATRNGVRLAFIKAAGSANLDTMQFSLGTSSMMDVANSLLLHPVPGIQLSQAGFTFYGSIQGDMNQQKVDGKLSVPVLSGNVAGNQLDRFATEVNMLVQANRKGMLIENLSGSLQHQGMDAGTFKVKGTYALESGAATVRLVLTNINQALLAPFANPALGGLQLSSIRVDADADASYSTNGISGVKGNLSVGNLVIQDPSGMIPSTPIGVAAAIDAGVQLGHGTMRLNVPLLRGAVTANGVNAGNFNAKADFSAETQKGNFQLSLAGLNQTLLAPLSKGLLGDKSLRSVDINATAEGIFDLANASDINASFSVTNLVVYDPSGTLPAKPLSLEVGVLGSMNEKILDFKKFKLKIDPTHRAENEIQVSGRVNLTDPTATEANLVVSANSLDVTPYFDLLQGQQPAPAAPAAEIPPPAGPPQEPAPITLPVKNSRFDVRIGRVYLREIEMSNFVATASVDRQSIALSPCQLYLSGAPVRAQVNLLTGVPGFQYNILFQADRVPIRPALMSFTPELGKRARGELVANMRIDGGGITGRNLKRNLNGNVDVYLTNAMIRLTEVKPAAPAPVSNSTFSMLKNIGKNFVDMSLKGVANFLGIPSVTESPITHVTASLGMGQGSFVVRSVDVRSAVLLAQAKGVIPIHDVLTESPLQIPVDIWLAKTVSGGLKLQHTEAPFTKLPSILTIVGTLGAPDTKVDTMGVVALGGSMAGGSAKGLVDGAEKAVGNLLGQGKSEVGNALKGLGGLFGGNKKQPVANQNTQTNKPSKNPFQLFNIPFPK